MASSQVDKVPEPSEEVRSKLSGAGPQPALLEVSPDNNGRGEEAVVPGLAAGGPLGSRGKPEKGLPTNGAVPRLDTSAVMEEGEGELEASTTVLLRRGEEGRKHNGPNLFRFSASTIDTTRADFTLTETFRVSGSACIVTLEEDCIHWTPTKRHGKETKHTVYLSDVFAVVPGTGKQTKRSSAPSQPTHFTLHILRSLPGCVGSLEQVSFKCPNSETCQAWAQQIHHQMQSYGSRPRRLYVLANPSGGGGTALKVWRKVEGLFKLAQIHTDLVYTQRRFFAREVVQALDLAQYDGLIVVGGDGLFNEVLNGLLIQTQHQAGVNLRRSRFVPVTANIRIGLIPAGSTNTVAKSIFGCSSPPVAAAQIMLGCSTPLDVCSVSRNGQLMQFCAGTMSYGFWSDTAFFSHDFTWLGGPRYDIAAIRALLARKHFEAEISFIPVEEPEEVLRNRERCFNRCPKCSNFEGSLETPSAAHEKGASVLATYTEVDRVDEREWKTVVGHFSSVVVCPHSCRSRLAPKGMSPWGHLGNGCADLIMLARCSKVDHAKWLFRHRKESASQFELPYVHIQRVKEFKFRELLRPVGRCPNDEVDTSVENLVQEVDDDEMTNNRAAARAQQRGEGPGVGMPTSRWNVDGDELNESDIDVRVHRHLLSVFARGIEPLHSNSSSSSDPSLEGEQQDLLPDSQT